MSCGCIACVDCYLGKLLGNLHFAIFQTVNPKQKKLGWMVVNEKRSSRVPGGKKMTRLPNKFIKYETGGEEKQWQRQQY
jgi:hypothetical protein